jgi:hypothetical protein
MHPRHWLTAVCLAGAMPGAAPPAAMPNVAAPAARPAAVSAPAPAAERLDQYGGYRDLPVDGGGTFRLAKVGSRWVFVTPDGHAFWMRAVYGIDITDGGGAYVQALQQKYGGDHIPWSAYVTQAARRMRGWGFNALGEYTSNYAWPVESHGRGWSNPERMPFVRYIGPSHYGKQPPFLVKDIQSGVDEAVTPGLWRVEGFPDVFDPAFAAAAANMARGGAHPELSEETLRSSPWIVGVTMDDRDYLFGFGAARAQGGWHQHLGWIAMATAPMQQANPRVWVSATQGVTYRDRTVHTKYAVRDFLRRRYGTLAALNAAWGSRYTTWDSDGAAWGRGQGVLDESGRGTWLGRDFYSLTDAAPAVRRDLDDLVELIAEKYFSTVAGAIRAQQPRHLVFGPAALSTKAHPAVLRAAGRHCDVLQLEGPWDTDAQLLAAYELARKPFFVWTTFMSQADSPLRGKPGWDNADHPTQAARGEAYAAFVRRALALRAPDGTHPVVGIDWWAWTDKVTGGEGNNFGLVTNLDNAYDGVEARRPTGRDRWGHVTGGEQRDYGDFLTAVTRANASILPALRADWAGGRRTGGRP